MAIDRRQSYVYATLQAAKPCILKQFLNTFYIQIKMIYSSDHISASGSHQDQFSMHAVVLTRIFKQSLTPLAEGVLALGGRFTGARQLAVSPSP